MLEAASKTQAHPGHIDDNNKHNKGWVVVVGVLDTASKIQAHPVAPLHIVHPWLQLLLWLADARWRKLDAAAPVEQLQHFLDVLQGHVAMLWVAHPHDTHEETGTVYLFHVLCFCLGFGVLEPTTCATAA